MQSSKTHTLIPIAAMLLFVLCYISAAVNYPGGSAVYPLEAGFSMRYNYLCDLLDTESVGGALNSGRYWARIGLFMLCMGLVYLWLKLPILVRAPLWKIQTMSTCAIVALISTGFLAMADHDTTVRVLSGISVKLRNVRIRRILPCFTVITKSYVSEFYSVVRIAQSEYLPMGGTNRCWKTFGFRIV